MFDNPTKGPTWNLVFRKQGPSKTLEQVLVRHQPNRTYQYADRIFLVGASFYTSARPDMGECKCCIPPLSVGNTDSHFQRNNANLVKSDNVNHAGQVYHLVVRYTACATPLTPSLYPSPTNFSTQSWSFPTFYDAANLKRSWSMAKPFRVDLS